MTHRLTLRVYYEDTDAGGIVYYANYLRFIERGRTEFVRARGVDQRALREAEGIVFAVRHIEADYLAPARLDDEIEVETSVESVGGARLTMRQEIFRDGVKLFSARVVLVAINEAGQAARLPANIRLLLH